MSDAPTSESTEPAVPRGLNLDSYIEDGRFVKRRDYTRYRWRFWVRLRRSKAEREKHCYDMMASIGVPIPPDVRIVVERNALGMLIRDEISTPFLAGSVDLRIIFGQPQHAHLVTDPAWRRSVLLEIARWVRHMHQNHFYPVNLHFRNILVRVDSDERPPPVTFIDCTAGSFEQGSHANYLRTKDLAYVYRDSRPHCSVREQLRFLHHYLGRRKLTAADRELIQSIIAYTQKKWGDRSSSVSQ